MIHPSQFHLPQLHLHDFGRHEIICFEIEIFILHESYLFSHVIIYKCVAFQSFTHKYTIHHLYTGVLRHAQQFLYTFNS